LRYVIAGEGEQREHIVERISALGLTESVLLVGLMNPVAPLLKCADLVVMPSLYEPLGMAQSEALVLGVPVVASHVGGIPETVTDGETGLLVEPGNLDAWTTALTWALHNRPRLRRMAQDGGKRVRSKFSVEANSAGLLQIIDLASQGQRPC
jgi:glycosyltransferase involved in cell wall biosynthesis